MPIVVLKYDLEKITHSDPCVCRVSQNRTLTPSFLPYWFSSVWIA